MTAGFVKIIKSALGPSVIARSALVISVAGCLGSSFEAAAEIAAGASQSPVFARSSQIGGDIKPSLREEDVPVELSFGLGWMICDSSPDLPPLETATSCQGLLPDLRSVKLVLTPQPVGNPHWHLWSAKYEEKTGLNKSSGTLEALVSYAKVDGKAYYFVEGRVGSSASTNSANYFEAVTDSLDHLQITTVYGAASPVSFAGQTSQWTPYMQFSRKDYGH